MLRASLLLVLLLLLLTAQVQAQPICLNNGGNYTSNSTYSDNLNTVLSSLPNTTTGFHNASAGRAHAVALCRADIQPVSCRACIRNITSDLLTSCPGRRQAVGWSEHCMLRYSDEPVYGILRTWPRVYLSSTQNATSLDRFVSDLWALLDGLRAMAVSGGVRWKAAAGNASGPDFRSIFAMVQCTPDLSAEDCGRCLVEAAGALSDCCRGSVGARVNLPSCNIRYEILPFYNESRLEELAGGHHTDEPGQPTRDPPLPPKPGVQKGNNITRVVVITVISVVACAMFFVFVCLVLRKKMRRKPEENHETAANEVSSDKSLVYALSTIRDATKDFSDDYKMGQGGFGPVYKGILPSGEEVAVKRLSQYSRQGDLEFKNEVLLLAKLQHRNLVRLLGFCLEGKEKLLVYEFMQNASLDHFIFDPIKRSYLDWEKRFKIIIGVARGILYLHEDSQLKIIHRDLKPSNVLLDGSMNAKIADFGTARLFAQDETHGSTSRIAGTLGYMAPEYAVHGKFSIKSDVYSFGVLLLEIISGQKNNRVREGENVEDLLSFVWRHWREGTAEQVLDPCLRSSSGFFINDVVRFIHIALLCVQEKATDRPTMASVIVMLSSSSLKLATPIEPASFMPADYGSETSLL